MSVEVIAGLALLGVAVGVLGTLVGAGGGFLLTPVLLIVYPNESAQTLTSISLAAVWANSTSGTIAYLRQRRVDVRSGLLFGVATLPGAVGGALLVGYVPRRAFDAIMAVVLAAVAIWLSIYRRWDFHRTRGGSPRLLVDASGREWRYAVRVRQGVVLSVGVGFLSSFLGIGGGIFHVPMLVTALGFPTHIATATSHFVLAMMSGAAVATHIAQGAYTVGHGLRRSIVLAVGLAVGAQIGARLSIRTSSVAIERLLVAGLAIAALRLAVTV
ncbi:MAG TPA: sulfite exporter TauE/SafE family protein [Gaiellaceae bacterium]|nr:sulfite exporter TauE/SafE family protein [Gaiellaceae bacterium]